MFTPFIRRVFQIAVPLILVASGFTPTNCPAQSGVVFPAANQSSFPFTFGLEENVGLSATVINGNYVVWFRGDRADLSGNTYLCGVQNLNVMSCPQDYIPGSTAPGQLTVFKNQVWMVYAQLGTNYPVICHSTDGMSLNSSSCTVHSEIKVADSPAIAATPDGTELDIAFQENASAHRLGIGYSPDGVSFSWSYPSNSFKLDILPQWLPSTGNCLL